MLFLVLWRIYIWRLFALFCLAINHLMDKELEGIFVSPSKCLICWLLSKVESTDHSWFQRRWHWLRKLEDGLHLFLYTTYINIGDPLIALRILCLSVVSSIIQRYWPHVSVTITSVDSFRKDIFGVRKNFLCHHIRSRSSSLAPRTTGADNKQICNRKTLCEGQAYNLSK